VVGTHGEQMRIRTGSSITACWGHTPHICHAAALGSVSYEIEFDDCHLVTMWGWTAESAIAKAVDLFHHQVVSCRLVPESGTTRDESWAQPSRVGGTSGERSP